MLALLAPAAVGFGLVEIRTGCVEVGLGRKIVSLEHLEGFEGVCQFDPLGGVQVEGVVGAETRALPQPVGAPRLRFYLDLHLWDLEGEVKQ